MIRKVSVLLLHRDYPKVFLSLWRGVQTPKVKSHWTFVTNRACRKAFTFINFSKLEQLDLYGIILLLDHMEGENRFVLEKGEGSLCRYGPCTGLSQLSHFTHGHPSTGGHHVVIINLNLLIRILS